MQHYFTELLLLYSFSMLDDFGNELENTDSKLDNTMKKVAKVLHISNNDRRQWMAILVLSLLLLVVLFLFIIL